MIWDRILFGRGGINIEDIRVDEESDVPVVAYDSDECGGKLEELVDIFEGDDLVIPSCIGRILSMSPPKTPSDTQGFYLACWLLGKGFSLDECKQVFKKVYGNAYVEKTADMQLKLIKLKECKPYSCFIVKHLLGICTSSCPYYSGITAPA